MKDLTFFEPIFQELRIRKIISHIPKGGTLVDIGCDQPQVLIDRVRDDMKLCIGIDAVVHSHEEGNVRIIHQNLDKKIPLEPHVAHCVTMLAVLEHMKHPESIISECRRILKKNGVLLITVPTQTSKPVLDLFAWLGLVREEMIEQHENYFTPDQIKTLCTNAGFSQVSVELFECGFNMFVRAIV